jgi:hypothetical protein
MAKRRIRLLNEGRRRKKKRIKKESVVKRKKVRIFKVEEQINVAVRTK